MIIYNPMTPKEATSLFLVMFTVVCALPAGVAVIPSAIAQEDDDMSLDDEEENLASDTVSNVLDNDNTAGDDTEVSVPITDIDQTDANLGLSEALDVTVERTLDDDELPPEDEAVFCLVDITFGILCFDTLEVCESVEDLFGRLFIVTGCEEFETLPSDARICTFVPPLSVPCEPPL
jgi:hypothetical protein